MCCKVGISFLDEDTEAQDNVLFEVITFFFSFFFWRKGVPRFEPRASHMLNRHPTTGIHPQHFLFSV